MSCDQIKSNLLDWSPFSMTGSIPGGIQRRLARSGPSNKGVGSNAKTIPLDAG